MSQPTADRLATSPVYVVIGATGGIGSALCRQVASLDARLVVAARDPERLDALAAETHAEAVPLDVTRSDKVDHCITRTVERYGRVDGVAHCVGTLLLKPAHLTSRA